MRRYLSWLKMSGITAVLSLVILNTLLAKEEDPILQMRTGLLKVKDEEKYFAGGPVSIKILIAWADTKAGQDAEQNAENNPNYKILLGTEKEPWFQNIRVYVRKAPNEEVTELRRRGYDCKGKEVKIDDEDEKRMKKVSLKSQRYKKDAPPQIPFGQPRKHPYPSITRDISPEETSELGAGTFILTVCMDLTVITNDGSKIRMRFVRELPIILYPPPTTDDEKVIFFSEIAGYYCHSDEINSDKAIEYQKKSVDIKPSDYRTHYGLGTCYCKAKKWELAIQSYETTLALLRAIKEPPSPKEELPIEYVIKDVERVIKDIKEYLEQEKTQDEDKDKKHDKDKDKDGKDDKDNKDDKPGQPDKKESLPPPVRDK